MRVSEKQEARREGLFQHKFKQRPKPIGWLCLQCGAMFTNSQLEKCRLKLFGEDGFDHSVYPPKRIKKEIKRIEGLYDLTEQIQDPHHYFYDESKG